MIPGIVSRLCATNSAEASSACSAWVAAATGEKLYQLTLIATICSIFSTVLLIVTVYLAYRATKAATRSTDISSEAVKLARESALTDQRPYVFHKSYNSTLIQADDISPFHTFRVVHTWLNSGRSVAHSRRSSISWGRSPAEGLPPNYKFDNRGTVGVPAPVGPDGEWFDWVDIPIDALEDAFLGRCQVHIWMWTEYDGNGTDQHYRTEKHQRVVPLSQPSRGLFNVEFYDAPNFNGADHSCMYPRD